MRKYVFLFFAFFLISCGNHDARQELKTLPELAAEFNQRMTKGNLPYHLPTVTDEYAKNSFDGKNFRVKQIGKGIIGYWSVDKEGLVDKIEIQESLFDRGQSDQEVRNDMNVIMTALVGGMDMDDQQASGFLTLFGKNYKQFLAQTQSEPTAFSSFDYLGRKFNISVVRNAAENNFFKSYIKYEAVITH